MFETTYAKNRMVKHIRHLFRARQDDLRRTTWTCVVRDGRVMVLKPFLAALDDHEVMGCVLRPAEVPSWFRTYWAVRRHWSVLLPIALAGVAAFRRRRRMALTAKSSLWDVVMSSSGRVNALDAALPDGGGRSFRREEIVFRTPRRGRGGDVFEEGIVIGNR